MNKMNKVITIDNMNITIPEGYTEITGEEAEKIIVCNGPAPMWSIYNAEKNVLLTASRIRAGLFTSIFINAKDMANSIRKKYVSGLRIESVYGNTYSDVRETCVDGNKAYTYSCTYRAISKDYEMVDMIRDTFVVKINDVFYLFEAIRNAAEVIPGANTTPVVYDSIQFAAAS